MWEVCDAQNFFFTVAAFWASRPRVVNAEVAIPLATSMPKILHSLYVSWGLGKNTKLDRPAL